MYFTTASAAAAAAGRRRPRFINFLVGTLLHQYTILLQTQL